MRSVIIGMLAETSIHPGSGQDAGFVDLPVAREAATDYPVIVGSSLKGALLDFARTQDQDVAESERERIFGKQEHAGQLLVGDARLLLLPVRSLQGAYKWVTCPHLLERFARDTARATGKVATDNENLEVDSNSYLGTAHDTLYLEEREFTLKGPVAPKIRTSIQPLMALSDQLEERLVVVNDDDFAWFARYGLAINARNSLDAQKKTSENLWYEETIPPDALFYSLLSERSNSGGGAIDAVLEMVSKRPYLQVGGNETVGQGWFAIQPITDAVAGGAV